MLSLPRGLETAEVRRGPYRYRLDWTWDARLPALTAVLLHPGIATVHEADYRTDKLYRFAISWGLGRLVVVGLYGLRAAAQADLDRGPDPEGPDNARHLVVAVQAADMVLCGWGQPVEAAHQRHARETSLMLASLRPDLHAFSIRPGHEWPWLPECVEDHAAPKPWRPA